MEDTHLEWDQITQKTWSGLGLTDPIKRIEVRSAPYHRADANIFVGQMATPPRFPQGERPGETTHRLIQLLCRRGY